MKGNSPSALSLKAPPPVKKGRSTLVKLIRQFSENSSQVDAFGKPVDKFSPHVLPESEDFLLPENQISIDIETRRDRSNLIRELIFQPNMPPFLASVYEEYSRHFLTVNVGKYLPPSIPLVKYGPSVHARELDSGAVTSLGGGGIGVVGRGRNGGSSGSDYIVANSVLNHYCPGYPEWESSFRQTPDDARHLLRSRVHTDVNLVVKINRCSIKRPFEPVFGSICMYTVIKDEFLRITENFYFDATPIAQRKLYSAFYGDAYSTSTDGATGVHLAASSDSAESGRDTMPGTTTSRLSINVADGSGANDHLNMFNIRIPEELHGGVDLYLVVQLSKILSVDADRAVLPYTKGIIPDFLKHQEACMRLINYRQPLGFGVARMRMNNGKFSSDSGKFVTIPIYTQRTCLSDHGLYQVIKEMLPTDGSSAYIRAEPMDIELKINIFDLGQDDQVMESVSTLGLAVPNPQAIGGKVAPRFLPSHIPSAKSPLTYSGDPADFIAPSLPEHRQQQQAVGAGSTVAPLIIRRVQPVLPLNSSMTASISRELKKTIDNTIFIYPLQLERFQHRNLSIKIELLQFKAKIDTKRSEYKVPSASAPYSLLPNIYNSDIISGPVFTTVAYTRVSYHNKTPSMNEEIKIRLPDVLTGQHWLKFTVQHVHVKPVVARKSLLSSLMSSATASTAASSSDGRGENDVLEVGVGLLPLMVNGESLLQDAEHVVQINVHTGGADGGGGGGSEGGGGASGSALVAAAAASGSAHSASDLSIPTLRVRSRAFSSIVSSDPYVEKAIQRMPVPVGYFVTSMMTRATAKLYQEHAMTHIHSESKLAAAAKDLIKASDLETASHFLVLMRMLQRCLIAGPGVFDEGYINPFKHQKARCQAFLTMLQVMNKLSIVGQSAHKAKNAAGQQSSSISASTAASSSSSSSSASSSSSSSSSSANEHSKDTQFLNAYVDFIFDEEVPIEIERIKISSKPSPSTNITTQHTAAGAAVSSGADGGLREPGKKLSFAEEREEEPRGEEDRDGGMESASDSVKTPTTPNPTTMTLIRKNSGNIARSPRLVVDLPAGTRTSMRSTRSDGSTSTMGGDSVSVSSGGVNHRRTQSSYATTDGVGHRGGGDGGKSPLMQERLASIPVGAVRQRVEQHRRASSSTSAPTSTSASIAHLNLAGSDVLPDGTAFSPRNMDNDNKHNVLHRKKGSSSIDLLDEQSSEVFTRSSPAGDLEGSPNRHHHHSHHHHSHRHHHEGVDGGPVSPHRRSRSGSDILPSQPHGATATTTTTIAGSAAPVGSASSDSADFGIVYVPSTEDSIDQQMLSTDSTGGQQLGGDNVQSPGSAGRNPADRGHRRAGHLHDLSNSLDGVVSPSASISARYGGGAGNGDGEWVSGIGYSEEDGGIGRPARKSTAAADIGEGILSADDVRVSIDLASRRNSATIQPRPLSTPRRSISRNGMIGGAGSANVGVGGQERRAKEERMRSHSNATEELLSRSDDDDLERHNLQVRSRASSGQNQQHQLQQHRLSRRSQDDLDSVATSRLSAGSSGTARSGYSLSQDDSTMQAGMGGTGVSKSSATRGQGVGLHRSMHSVGAMSEFRQSQLLARNQSKQQHHGRSSSVSSVPFSGLNSGRSVANYAEDSPLTTGGSVSGGSQQLLESSTAGYEFEQVDEDFIGRELDDDEDEEEEDDGMRAIKRHPDRKMWGAFLTDARWASGDFRSIEEGFSSKGIAAKYLDDIAHHIVLQAERIVLERQMNLAIFALTSEIIANTSYFSNPYSNPNSTANPPSHRSLPATPKSRGSSKALSGGAPAETGKGVKNKIPDCRSSSSTPSSPSSRRSVTACGTNLSIGKALSNVDATNNNNSNCVSGSYNNTHIGGGGGINSKSILLTEAHIMAGKRFRVNRDSLRMPFDQEKSWFSPIDEGKGDVNETDIRVVSKSFSPIGADAATTVAATADDGNSSVGGSVGGCSSSSVGGGGPSGATFGGSPSIHSAAETQSAKAALESLGLRSDRENDLSERSGGGGFGAAGSLHEAPIKELRVASRASLRVVLDGALHLPPAPVDAIYIQPALPIFDSISGFKQRATSIVNRVNKHWWPWIYEVLVYQWGAVLAIILSSIGLISNTNINSIVGSYPFEFDLTHSAQKPHKHVWKDARNLLMEQGPILLKMIYKSIVLRVKREKKRPPVKLDDQFVNALDNLVMLLALEMSTFSAGLWVSRKMNRSLSKFLKSLFAVATANQVLRLVRSYFKALKGRNRVDETELRLQMLEEISLFDHTVAVNFPLVLDASFAALLYSYTDTRTTMSSTVFKGHSAFGIRGSTNPAPYTLSHMFVNEVMSAYRQEEKKVKNGALEIMRDMLVRHVYDERFQTPYAQQRVCCLYIPLIREVLVEYTRFGKLRHDSVERRELLAMLIYVLQGIPESMLRHQLRLLCQATYETAENNNNNNNNRSSNGGSGVDGKETNDNKTNSIGHTTPSSSSSSQQQQQTGANGRPTSLSAPFAQKTPLFPDQMAVVGANNITQHNYKSPRVISLRPDRDMPQNNHNQSSTAVTSYFQHTSSTVPRSEDHVRALFMTLHLILDTFEYPKFSAVATATSDFLSVLSPSVAIVLPSSSNNPSEGGMNPAGMQGRASGGSLSGVLGSPGGIGGSAVNDGANTMYVTNVRRNSSSSAVGGAGGGGVSGGGDNQSKWSLATSRLANLDQRMQNRKINASSTRKSMPITNGTEERKWLSHVQRMKSARESKSSAQQTAHAIGRHTMIYASKQLCFSSTMSVLEVLLVMLEEVPPLIIAAPLTIDRANTFVLRDANIDESVLIGIEDLRILEFIRMALCVILHALYCNQEEAALVKLFSMAKIVIRRFGAKIFLASVEDALQDWMRTVMYHCSAAADRVRDTASNFLLYLLRSSFNYLGSITLIVNTVLAVMNDVIAEVLESNKPLIFTHSDEDALLNYLNIAVTNIRDALQRKPQPLPSTSTSTSTIATASAMRMKASLHTSFAKSVVSFMDKLEIILLANSDLRRYVTHPVGYDFWGANLLDGPFDDRTSALVQIIRMKRKEVKKDVGNIGDSTSGHGLGLSNSARNVGGPYIPPPRTGGFQIEEIMMRFVKASEVYDPIKLPRFRMQWLENLARLHELKGNRAEGAEIRWKIFRLCHVVQDTWRSQWVPRPPFAWNRRVADFGGGSTTTTNTAATAGAGGAGAAGSGSSGNGTTHSTGHTSIAKNGTLSVGAENSALSALTVNSLSNKLGPITGADLESIRINSHSFITSNGNRNFFNVFCDSLDSRPFRAWRDQQQYILHMETALSVATERFCAISLVHLAERSAQHLIRLYRLSYKTDKMAEEYMRISAALKSVMAKGITTSMAIGKFYRVSYTGKGVPPHLRGKEFIFRNANHLHVSEFQTLVVNHLKSVVREGVTVKTIQDATGAASNNNSSGSHTSPSPAAGGGGGGEDEMTACILMNSVKLIMSRNKLLRSYVSSRNRNLSNLTKAVSSGAGGSSGVGGGPYGGGGAGGAAAGIGGVSFDSDGESISGSEELNQVSSFMYSVAFTIIDGGRKAHAKKIDDQWMRTTILTVKYPFPYVLTRQEVLHRETRDYSPIEVAINDIEERLEAMEAELEREIKNPSDCNDLMRIIQGTVMPQVNAGAGEVAKVFLDPNRMVAHMLNQLTGEQQQYQQQADEIAAADASAVSTATATAAVVGEGEGGSGGGVPRSPRRGDSQQRMLDQQALAMEGKKYQEHCLKLKMTLVDFLRYSKLLLGKTRRVFIPDPASSSSSSSSAGADGAEGGSVANSPMGGSNSGNAGGGNNNSNNSNSNNSGGGGSGDGISSGNNNNSSSSSNLRRESLTHSAVAGHGHGHGHTASNSVTSSPIPSPEMNQYVIWQTEMEKGFSNLLHSIYPYIQELNEAHTLFGPIG